MHESPSEVQSTWGVVEAAREVGVTFTNCACEFSADLLDQLSYVQILCSMSKNLEEAVVIRKG